MGHRRGTIGLVTLSVAFVCAAAVCAQDGSDGPDLSFWTVGSGGPAKRFGSGFYKTLESDRSAINRILLAVAQRPLGDAQIAQQSGLGEDQVRDLLSKLAEVHIVRRGSDDRWETTLPVITDDEMLRIRRTLTPFARGVAESIRENLPNLTALYERTKSPSDPPWSDAAHLIVDKFLVDGSFHSAVGEVELAVGAGRYYNDDQNILPVFFLERGPSFATFGSNWYEFKKGEEKVEVYVLHGSLFGRYEIRMNEYRKDSTVSSALHGLTPSGGIDTLGQAEMDVLGSLGWIEDGRLRAPVIRAATIKSLLPTLDEVGSSAAMVVSNHYSAIVEAYEGSDYSAFLGGAGDYLQVCYHVLFGITLEQLVEVGAIPPVPDPVPEYFGAYVIIGSVY